MSHTHDARERLLRDVGLVVWFVVFAGVVTALETTAIAAQQSIDLVALEVLTTMSTPEATAEPVVAK